jgi:hypothetical protein
MKMKNITKFIAAAIVVAVSFFATKARAQGIPLGQVKFDVGLEGGAPTYDARQLSNVMGGATGRFQVGLGDYLTVIATSGFYNFFDKTSTINGVSVKEPGLGVVPLKAGLKGYLGNTGLYLTGEVGVGFETSKDDETGNYDTKDILSAGLGYVYHNWDYGVRYESLTGDEFNYGIIALRVAYSIKL